ncbi:hypothetical protein VNO78_21476 [Psophocarpus tetragonolobus]|uniref:Uncharacterized protein n=1 Tax=Psophocarpus tetragonolobus TaxID=3891 RepID=A0AAN9XI42_PSOTE
MSSFLQDFCVMCETWPFESLVLTQVYAPQVIGGLMNGCHSIHLIILLMKSILMLTSKIPNDKKSQDKWKVKSGLYLQEMILTSSECAPQRRSSEKSFLDDIVANDLNGIYIDNLIILPVELMVQIGDEIRSDQEEEQIYNDASDELDLGA